VDYRRSAWRRISSPALDGLQYSAILAKTATDVSAIATVGGSPPQRLVHFNGQRWTSVAVPSSAQLGGMAADGMRGEWFTATQSSSKAPVAEHRSSTGTWSSHVLPGGTGQAFGIALIPGTTSLWAPGPSRRPGARTR
jgi:hypothetical protein